MSATLFYKRFGLSCLLIQGYGWKCLFLPKTSLMTNTGWNREEFVCFLLIYTSHVDMEFSDEEKESLKNQFSAEIFEKQFALFSDMNDYQALDAILKYKEQYFSTPELKQQLLDSIRSQFFTDGEFSDFEKEIYHSVERML